MSLLFRRHPQRDEKPRDHVVRRNRGGQLDNLRGVEMLFELRERIRTRQRHSKGNLYALHAPEVERISKGKARNPYEFGVKVNLVVTHKQGLMVGARSHGNPYYGHVLNAQLEQTTNLRQDTGRSPKHVIVDLGYRDFDGDTPGVQIIHRGKYKSLSEHERRLLRRRQAIKHRPRLSRRSELPDSSLVARKLATS